jgi:hypothetical protein
MAKGRKSTKMGKSIKKKKKQSPKQGAIKLAGALAKAVDNYGLAAAFDKKLAQKLGGLLKEAEEAGTFVAATGWCEVAVNGSTVGFPSTKPVCDAAGGTWFPE